MDMAQYLLANQQAQQGQAQMPQAPQPMMPQMPMGQMPPMAMNPMGEAATAATQSPIKAGTLAGMQAAKQSLEMNDSEQRRAMGAALINFFGNMSKSHNPDMLGRINESFAPGLAAYQSEQARMAQMKAYALDRQDKLEKQNRDFEELSAYQKAQLATQREIAGLRHGGGGASEIPLPDGTPLNTGRFPRIESKATLGQMAKKQQFTSHILHKLGTIYDMMDKLDNVQKNSAISPYNPYDVIRKPVNAMKDAYSDTGLPGSQTLKDERELREKFNSTIKVFQIEAENAARGGGAVPASLIAALKAAKTYPEDGQRLGDMRAKFDLLRKEAYVNNLALDLSLKSHRLIGANDVASLLPESEIESYATQGHESQQHGGSEHSSANMANPNQMGAQQGALSNMEKIQLFRQKHPAETQGESDDTILQAIEHYEQTGDTW